MTRALAVLVPALALLPAGAAQEPPAPLPTLRITVTLVQVDATVTDSAGRRVTDLHADDFELLQDGQPQTLKLFAYSPQQKPVPAVAPALIAEDAPIAPSDVKRTIALVVDDLALSFQDLARTRQALRDYVTRNMQRGDLVAVVRTGGSIAMIEQFTTDKRVLLEAIDLLKWRFAGRTGMGHIEPLGAADLDARRTSPESLDYGYTLSVLGSLGALEQVVQGMKNLPGRKSVVFLSNGLRQNTTINSALDHLTDLANRSAVSIYSIDPGGLRTNEAQTQNAVPRTPVPSNGPRVPAVFSDSEEASDEPEFGGLQDLATHTGGLGFHDRNDIPECIEQAAEDQSGYYLLAYTPREGTFEKNPDKAKFHRITVRVRRPGLHVRWKSGFNGVSDDAPAVQTPQTRERQILETMASPFAAKGLDVRLTSLFYHNAKDGPFVYSMLHIGARGLSFIHEPAGDWHTTIDLVSLAYRGFDEPMLQHQMVREIRLSDAQHNEALREGLVYNLGDPVKQPGAFILRVVVRDHASQAIGSASQFVTVPDTRKNRFAITGLMLNLAGPEILKQLGVDQHSGPAAEGLGEPWKEGGPALRRYLSSQDIVFGYSIVNPKVHGHDNQFDVVSQVRLYANGKLIYTGNERSVVAVAQDPAHLHAGGVLRLGSRMLPGEYLLQVTVTDRGQKKHPQATQFIDFQVTQKPLAIRSLE
ncbi:MAG TPA: VWA domain-containing protein [Candidatus Limnocylindrales bacterium]|nr:VWA domain-containing protein [Candidatus Limnocylindrales bacterium]